MLEPHHSPADPYSAPPPHLHRSAHLLKAQYQRNMLIGLAVAVLAVTVPALTVAYWPEAPVDLVDLPPGGYDRPDTIVIDAEVFRPVRVTPTRPPSGRAGAGGGATAIHPGQGRGFRPVADDAASAFEPSGPGGWGGALQAQGDFGLPVSSGDGGGPVLVPNDSVYGLFSVIEQPPELIYTPEPAYPPLARRLGLEGRVVVHALVGLDGRVDSAVVAAESDPNASFGEYAVRVARQAHFRPGIQNRRPVRCWVSFVVEFDLKD